MVCDCESNVFYTALITTVYLLILAAVYKITRLILKDDIKHKKTPKADNKMPPELDQLQNLFGRMMGGNSGSNKQPFSTSSPVKTNNTKEEDEDNIVIEEQKKVTVPLNTLKSKRTPLHKKHPNDSVNPATISNKQPLISPILSESTFGADIEIEGDVIVEPNTATIKLEPNKAHTKESTVKDNSKTQDTKPVLSNKDSSTKKDLSTSKVEEKVKKTKVLAEGVSTFINGNDKHKTEEMD